MKRLCSAAPLSMDVGDCCCKLVDDDESPLYRGPHPASFREALAANLVACKNLSLEAAGSAQKLQAASCVCAALTEALSTITTKDFFVSARARLSRLGLYALLDAALLPIAKLVEENDAAPSLAQSALQCLANLLVDAPTAIRKEAFGSVAQALAALASEPTLEPSVQRHACRAIGSLVVDSSGEHPNDPSSCGRLFAPALFGCMVRASAADATSDIEVLQFRKQTAAALANVVYASRNAATWTTCAEFEPALRAVQRELLLSMKSASPQSQQPLARAGAVATDAEAERHKAVAQVAMACAKLVNSLAKAKLGWAAAKDVKRAMPLLMLVVQLPFGALNDRAGSCSTPASQGLEAINELNQQAMIAGPAEWATQMKAFVKAGGIAALAVAIASPHADTYGWAACLISNLVTATFKMQQEHNVTPPVRFADDRAIVQALLHIAVQPESKMKSKACALHALAGLCTVDAGSRNNVAKLHATRHIVTLLVQLEPSDVFVPSPGPNPQAEVGTPEVVERAFGVLQPLSFLASEHKQFLKVPGGLGAISSLLCASWMRPRTSFDRRYLTLGFHMLAELACDQACRKQLQSISLIDATLEHLHSRVPWRGNPDSDRFIGSGSPLEFEYYALMFLMNCCTGEMEEKNTSPLANRLVLHLPLIECLVRALAASTTSRCDPACSAVGMAIGVMGILCQAAMTMSSKSKEAQDDGRMASPRSPMLYQVASMWQGCQAFQRVIRTSCQLVEEITVVGASLQCMQLALLSDHEAAIAAVVGGEGGLDRVLARHAHTPDLAHEVGMVNTLRGSKQLMASTSDPVAFEATRASMRETMQESMVDMMARMAPDGDAATKDKFWDMLAQTLPPEMRRPELLEECRKHSHALETVKQGSRHRQCTPRMDATVAEAKMTQAVNMNLADSGERQWMCFNPQCMSAESADFMKCACGRARYCSKDCQRIDWRVHKLTCTARKSKK